MSEGPQVADARDRAEMLELAARAAFQAFGHDVATPMPWEQAPEDFRITFRMVADAVLMVTESSPRTCTCTMLSASTPWQPAEWEQAEACPVHPMPAAAAPTGCPRCGHAPHQQPCLNMASDNECSCPGAPTPAPTEAGEGR